MTHLLERLRPKRKFSKIDVLSRFGETICLPEMEIPAPKVAQARSHAIVEDRAWEEDPERWDGLS
jgi:hypothetical protein